MQVGRVACGKASSMEYRIIIIGAPGAGKSTLAHGLSEQLNIPNYPLDPVAFVDEHWTLRDPGERSQMVDEIAAQPCWIADGVHLGWTNPLLAAATHILWLDPPWWTLLWRAWNRHISRWANLLPSMLELRSLIVEGWYFVGRYYWQRFQPGVDLDLGRNLSRAATAATIARYAHKVRRYRDARLASTTIAHGLREQERSRQRLVSPSNK
jgi:adenylate kinase family enzyme